MLPAAQILVAVATFSTLLTTVLAHGTIGLIEDNGKTYTGPPISLTGQHPPSAVRQVSDVSPVKDLSGHDLICGYNAASSAQEKITVKAGDTLDITWKSGLGPTWPHLYGPIITWMAQCTDSKTCGGGDLKFFKIQQKGQTTPGANAWFQKDIHDGKAVAVTIPADIPSGDYLLRHEVIALHNAMAEGGAEFYPQCVQLHVTNGGTAQPPANILTTFPGAYKADDPGLLINLYNGPFNYVFPGPPVFGSSGAVNAPHTPNAPATVSPATATPPPASQQTPSTSSKAPKKCPIKKRNARSVTASTANATSHRRSMEHHRRALSRAMPRRLSERDFELSAAQ